MAVRQDVGGAWSIALAFKNDARLSIPWAPRNFRSCGGILLRPLLFVALYLCVRTSVSSLDEMWWAGGVVSGVNVSGMMSSSKNMSSLNFVNLSSGISIGLLSCYFSMFQNLIGLYFSISGSSNYSSALWVLQHSLNFVYAIFVWLWFLPCLLFVFLYVALASLQDSSNHGARCFAHLFGFMLILRVLLLITPIFFASRIRNSSILLVRRSLSCLNVSDIVLNCFANMAVDVCAFQSFALLLYSATQSPYIHWWSSWLFISSSVVSAGGVELFGGGDGVWMAVGGGMGRWVAWGGWEVGDGGGGGVVAEVIGR